LASSGVRKLGKSEIDLAAPLLDGRPEKGYLRLQPGKIIELLGDTGSGLTRLGLSLLAEPSQTGPVVVVDTRGWISPEAAWETGVVAESLVIVRCHERPLWTRVTAALLEGVPAVFAEVPPGIKDQELRRLSALARARKTLVVLRPMRMRLPSGVSHLRIRSLGITWEGADQGHGKLKGRRILLEATGKGAGGITRRFEVQDGGRGMVEVEDEGKDTLRLVSNVVSDQARRAAG
jgi:hypothetical protein